MLQAIQYPKRWFIKVEVLERDLHPLGSGELSLQAVCNHRIILVGRDLKMSLLKLAFSKHVQYQTRLFAQSFLLN